MTSNNTIEYIISDKDGNIVGTHSQNIMTMRCNDKLFKFTPAEDFRIVYAEYYDGSEGYGEPMPLNEWLLKHPAEITSKIFVPSASVRARMKVDGKWKRVEGTVVEIYKGTWFPHYTIRLADGTLMENISQTEILPK